MHEREPMTQVMKASEARMKDFDILDEMREAFKDVPPEDIVREVTHAIEQVRAENRERQVDAQPR